MQGEELSIDDFSNVIDLSWAARKKWYFIGVRFSMQVLELDVIEKNNNNDIDEQFRKMIKKWLEMGGTGCTWKAIYDALRHHTVGLNSIAEELKKRLPSLHKGQKKYNCGAVFKSSTFNYRYMSKTQSCITG